MIDNALSLPSASNTALGKYVLVSKIASGSMGTVYLARDSYSEELVAIKVTMWGSYGQSCDPQYKKLFFNEVSSAQCLQHPNIARVLDAGFTDTYSYLVMEYVEGGKTLENHLKGSTRLPIETVVSVAYQCARALAYAHRKGVIHRDIKPGNILITPTYDAKIADFGIAKLTETSKRMTHPQGFSGTPLYMSPEQAMEDQVTAQSDIFSLGVVLYELLTGQHPFAADNLSRLVYRVCHEEPRALAEFHPPIPDVLQSIVGRTLQKDRMLRYRTADVLATDLADGFESLSHSSRVVELQERFEQVRRLAFFAGFPLQEVWEIVRAGPWENHDDGEVVFSEGDHLDVFYVIVRGTVRVIKQDVYVMTLGEGDCFGEMGYLARTKRTATVQAGGAVSLLRFSPEVMNALSKSCQVRFLKVFLRTLILRLSRTTEQATGH